MYTGRSVVLICRVGDGLPVRTIEENFPPTARPPAYSRIMPPMTTQQLTLTRPPCVYQYNVLLPLCLADYSLMERSHPVLCPPHIDPPPTAPLVNTHGTVFRYHYTLPLLFLTYLRPQSTGLTRAFSSCRRYD